MKLCMIGTGYVGLVSGVCFSDLGNKVYCVDKDIKKINSLNKGLVPIYEPGLEEILKKNYKQKRLFFTKKHVQVSYGYGILVMLVGMVPATNKILAKEIRSIKNTELNIFRICNRMPIFFYYWIKHAG